MRFEPVTSTSTGVMLYQLSYEVTYWEQVQFTGFISSHIISLLMGRYEPNKY